MLAEAIPPRYPEVINSKLEKSKGGTMSDMTAKFSMKTARCFFVRNRT